MALDVLRRIITAIHASSFLSIMIDETTDVSNKEQVVVCIRSVDEELQVNEDFNGLHQVESTAANDLYAVIQDVLTRMNVSVNKVRGQCYDGASSMSGIKEGVAASIQQQEPRAVYTHCYGHALNLACGDAEKLRSTLCNEEHIGYVV